MASPPLLSTPEEGEELQLYLAVLGVAVAAALVREDGRSQRPVYYVSKVLQGAELKYPPIEKIALALVTAARKLKPYFEAHPIVVLTSFPLRQVLQKPEASGRLLKWAVELTQYDVEYRPRTAIKAQALADFVVECTGEIGEGSEQLWMLQVDGTSGKDGAGGGIVLTSPEGVKHKHALRLDFAATNNEAEYEALIAGLKAASEVVVGAHVVLTDSQLVANQVLGEYEARNPGMASYRSLMNELITNFAKVSIQQVLREEMEEANELSKVDKEIAVSEGIGFSTLKA